MLEVDESFLITEHGAVMNDLEILLKLFRSAEISIVFYFRPGRKNTQNQKIIQLMK